MSGVKEQAIQMLKRIKKLMTSGKDLALTKQQAKALQEKLGYTFNDPALLMAALTHSSYANENRGTGAISNERLEFLGDSVLGMAVAAHIYKSYPELPEGRMTRLRAELVCEKSLAALAREFGLGEVILLGRGEGKGGGGDRPSILADAVEAILAAIYLDGGFEPVARLIEEHLAPDAKGMLLENTDYKTALQELVQERAGRTLSYHITAEHGPDHKKSFTSEVRVNGKLIGEGAGKSKKEAEQSAAKTALKTMRCSS